MPVEVAFGIASYCWQRSKGGLELGRENNRPGAEGMVPARGGSGLFGDWQNTLLLSAKGGSNSLCHCR